MKPILPFLVLLLLSASLSSQILDGVYAKQTIATDRLVPYTSLREADVMWSRTVWRKIDLREKLNLPLYYPIQPIGDRQSLSQVLIEAVKEGSLTAFAPMDDDFTTVLSRAEIEKLFFTIDTMVVDDPDNPDQQIIKIIKNELDLSEIIEYRIKEEWFFDKQRSVMDVRIVGIMPVRKEMVEDEVRSKPLFWIYFPEARTILNNKAVFNRQNDAARLSYDDIFSKRMFASYIYKENNVYDRTIGDYTYGQDALLEADRIKKNMFDMESDYWEY